MIATAPGPIIIVDDQADVRAALRQMFELEQLQVIEFGDGEAVLAAIDPSFSGIVISDLRMPGLDGSALFGRLRLIDAELPVIMMSGHGDVATAVDLVKRGAYDFLSKPFDGDALIATARRALEKRSLVLENRALRRQPVLPDRDAIWGESPQIEQFCRTLNQLAEADIDVLISGESGSGKSLAAQILHRRSTRGRKAMTVVDCAATSGDQAASLLFGHVSGAFPGAQFPRVGQLLHADGSTVFLDHVDRLSPDLQTRISQTLERRMVLPIGGNREQSSHFRTISASSANLVGQVESGNFDRSLYFRLSAYRLEVPSLRARRNDVMPLFRRFLSEAATELKRDVPQMSAAVWRKLQEHEWPGNVRELRNFAGNVALGLGEARTPPSPIVDPISSGLKVSVAGYEADLIRAMLGKHSGDIAATVAALDVPRKTFYDKLARHGIDPNDYRPSQQRQTRPT